MRTVFTLIVALLTTAPSVAFAQASRADAGAAGWQALQDNNGEQARRLFDAALATNPRDAVLHLGAGAAAHMLERDDEAIASLRTALTLDPSVLVASRMLAEIAWQRGDLPLAINTYQQALIYAPDNNEIASRLARLQGESARRASAAQLKVTMSGPRQDVLLDRATHVANTVYWQVAKLVGAYPAQIITLDLDTTKPFQASIAARTAADDDAPVRLNAGDALADAEVFDRVLTTALVDAMVTHMAPTGVPAWFPRGLAQVVATADTAVARQRLRELGEIPWTRLDSIAYRPEPDEQAEADASLLIVRALLARIGSKSTQLLDDLSDGHSLDAALAQFGFSWADLKADVVRSLQQ